MPLNSIPPTTTVANLDAKRDATRGQCYVDVAFWGGVIPGNQVRTRFLQLEGGAIKAHAHFTGSSCPSCPIWCERVQMLSDREWCGCAWTRGSFWLNPTYLLLGIPLRERGGSHAVDEGIGSKHPFSLVNDFVTSTLVFVSEFVLSFALPCRT